MQWKVTICDWLWKISRQKETTSLSSQYIWLTNRGINKADPNGWMWALLFDPGDAHRLWPETWEPNVVTTSQTHLCHVYIVLPGTVMLVLEQFNFLWLCMPLKLFFQNKTSRFSLLSPFTIVYLISALRMRRVQRTGISQILLNKHRVASSVAN